MLRRQVFARALFTASLVSFWLVSCGGGNTPGGTLPVLDQIPLAHGTTLTTQQVLNYVPQYAFEGGPTVSGRPPVIEQIKAMSGKQAEAYVKTTITGDNRPVIFVLLYGPFIITDLLPHMPAGKQPISDRVWEIFDATTGTIPVWGVYGA